MSGKVGFVCFGSNEYEHLVIWNSCKAKDEYGFDNIFIYDEKDIRKIIPDENRIIEAERGFGFWLWKPAIIMDALGQIENGDILLYMDAGDKMIKNPKEIIKKLTTDRDIYLTIGGCKNSIWTKRDCFILMNCEAPEYWNTPQVEAGIILIKKSDLSVGIIEEWLRWCEDERILTDMPNTCGLPNFDDYVDHRHDQSVLTNLAVKYDIYRGDEMREYVECNAFAP